MVSVKEKQRRLFVVQRVLWCIDTSFSLPRPLWTTTLYSEARPCCTCAGPVPEILRDELSAGRRSAMNEQSRSEVGVYGGPPFPRRGEPKLNKYSLHPVCIKGLHTWL